MQQIQTEQSQTEQGKLNKAKLDSNKTKYNAAWQVQIAGKEESSMVNQTTSKGLVAIAFHHFPRNLGKLFRKR